MLISYLKNNYKLARSKREWRSRNKHNQTRVNRIFNQSIVSVGLATYGTITVLSSSNLSKVKIGNYCSIADDVVFIINNDHPLHHISTYPFKTRILKNGNDVVSKGNIVVQDDVWIGNKSTILSGVTIGQGAVVAAGSIVTKDVPPYAVVGGTPARIIKYRFNDDVVKKLLQIDFSKIDKTLISEHIDDLYKDISSDSNFDWLPKKN